MVEITLSSRLSGGGGCLPQSLEVACGRVVKSRSPGVEGWGWGLSGCHEKWIFPPWASDSSSIREEVVVVDCSCLRDGKSVVLE